MGHTAKDESSEKPEGDGEKHNEVNKGTSEKPETDLPPNLENIAITALLLVTAAIIALSILATLWELPYTVKWLK